MTNILLYFNVTLLANVNHTIYCICHAKTYWIVEPTDNADNVCATEKNIFARQNVRRCFEITYVRVCCSSSRRLQTAMHMDIIDYITFISKNYKLLEGLNKQFIKEFIFVWYFALKSFVSSVLLILYRPIELFSLCAQLAFP